MNRSITTSMPFIAAAQRDDEPTPLPAAPHEECGVTLFNFSLSHQVIKVLRGSDSTHCCHFLFAEGLIVKAISREHSGQHLHDNDKPRHQHAAVWHPLVLYPFLPILPIVELSFSPTLQNTTRVGSMALLARSVMCGFTHPPL